LGSQTVSGGAGVGLQPIAMMSSTGKINSTILLFMVSPSKWLDHH
jgi:hypothetical protein